MQKLRELTEKRYYNKKHFETDVQGVFVMEAHAGHIHYKNNGKLEDIDTTLQNCDYGWEMNKASYRLKIPKYANDWFWFTNRYREEASHTVKFRPDINQVEGKLVINGDWANKSVEYKDVLPGIDMLVIASNIGLQRKFIIRENVLLNKNEDLEIPIEIETNKDIEVVDNNLDKSKVEQIEQLRYEIKQHSNTVREYLELKVNSQSPQVKVLTDSIDKKLEAIEKISREKWLGEKIIETSQSIIIREGVHFSKIFKPSVWDSNKKTKKHQHIKFRIEKKNGKTYFIKVVPREFLMDAVFPVITDDTSTYYAGAGDGSVRYDTYPSSWGDVVGAATGSGKDDADDTIYFQNSSAASNDCQISRLFFPIDTSGLPDTATISAATFYLYFTSDTILNCDQDGNNFIRMGANSQASGSALDVADYDQIGSTALCSDVGLGDLTNSQYNTFGLNATGIAAISKTGYTQIGFRGGFDINNHRPSVACSSSAWSHHIFYVNTSRYTGTSRDPYISITYTASQNYTKTLTEVVKAGGAIIKQTQKTLTQLFKVIVPTNAPFVQVSKTFTQTIKVLANKINQLNRTLSERFIVGGIYQKALTAYKTLTEVVIASDVFSRIQNLTKTLTEVIKLFGTFERVMTLYRTFVETIKASGVFTSAATLYKTLSETIIASDITVGIKKIFLETFNEVIKLSGNISFATTKVLTETIKIIGSFITNASRTFIERIVASDIYSVIRNLARTFTETINVVASKITDIGRIFSERVKITDPAIGTQKTKTFVESIIVRTQYAFSAMKVFVENIIIGAQKLTHRAFTFTQRFIVGAMFAKTPTKVLLQRIKAGDQPEFNKIQYTVLTEAFKVVSGFVRVISRNFFEVINVVGSVVSRTTRIFTETISVATDFVALFGHVLLEKIIAVGSLASWSIGKLIVQSLKVIDSVGKASAWLMSEVIKVSENFVATAHKVLTEIINVVSSMRFAMGKIFTHVIRVDNIRIFNHIFYTIKTESLKVLDTITHGISRTFNEVVIVIGAIGSWSIAKLFIEPIKVVASFLRTWTLSRVFTEVIKGGSEAYQQSIKIFRETINVISSTVIPVPAKVFYETLKVVQNITKSLPKTFEEVLAVVGNMSNNVGKTFVEAINVVGTFVLGTISKLLIEVVKISGNITKSLSLRVFSETIKIVSNLYNQGAKTFNETIQVVGQFVLGTISKLFIEIIKTIETYARAWTLSRVFAETIKVVEVYSNQAGKIFTEVVNVVGTMANFTIGKLFLEVATISQSITKLTSRTFTQAINVIASFVKFTYGRIFGEIISVGEAMTRSIGRLFTEHIGIDWDKIKLVLNGIQVGLWKKVARITNGVWRKISRNDTL